MTKGWMGELLCVEIDRFCLGGGIGDMRGFNGHQVAGLNYIVPKLNKKNIKLLSDDLKLMCIYAAMLLPFFRNKNSGGKRHITMNKPRQK